MTGLTPSLSAVKSGHMSRAETARSLEQEIAVIAAASQQTRVWYRGRDTEVARDRDTKKAAVQVVCTKAHDELDESET